MTDSPADPGTIVVCLKWVATSPEIDPLTGEVVTDRRFSGLSPADQAALEWGLRIAEARGLQVMAVSVGDAEAEEGLRHALALGAADVLLIETNGVEPSSRQVAGMLASSCRTAAMVLCGDHSLDRGSGSVPAFLAHELAFGQALGCVGVDLSPSNRAMDDRSMVVERRLDQGRREQLLVSFGTVLSFEGGLEPRRAPLTATVAATATSVPTVAGNPTVGPVAATVTSTGPYRPRAMASTAPVGSTLDRIRQLTGAGQERASARQLELDPVDAAEVVVDQLRTWGYLEPAEPGGDSAEAPSNASDDDGTGSNGTEST